MLSNRPVRSLNDSVATPATVLVCAACHTAEHLISESIQPHTPGLPGTVEVEYSCGRCQSYSAHACSVQTVATLLNHETAIADETGVIKFGGQYIHCGEPMEYADSLTFPINQSNNPSREELLGDKPSGALQCQCGFQLEPVHPRRN